MAKQFARRPADAPKNREIEWRREKGRKSKVGAYKIVTLTKATVVETGARSPTLQTAGAKKERKSVERCASQAGPERRQNAERNNSGRTLGGVSLADYISELYCMCNYIADVYFWIIDRFLNIKISSSNFLRLSIRKCAISNIITIENFLYRSIVVWKK